MEKVFIALGAGILFWVLLNSYRNSRLKVYRSRRKILEQRLRSIATGDPSLIGDDPLIMPSDSTAEERAREAQAVQRKRRDLGLDDND